MIVLVMVISTLIFFKVIKFRMISKGQTGSVKVLLRLCLTHLNSLMFGRAGLKKISVLWKS